MWNDNSSSADMLTVGQTAERLHGVCDTYWATADSALQSLEATRAEPYQNTGKSVPGSFSFSSFSTEKLKQSGFKWPVPVIKRVPQKGDSSTGTPWGEDTNPTIKELAGAWEHMQEATNTTSQCSWASLCRSEDRGRCGKHLGEGLFGEDRSSPGELTTPTLRPWLCVKAFTTLCLHLFHNMPVFTSRTWVSWGRGRRHVYLSGSTWYLVDAQWILEKWMNEWGERYRLKNTRTKFPIIRQMLQQLRLCFYTETEICWGKGANQMWHYVPLPGKIILAILKKKTF